MVFARERTAIVGDKVLSLNLMPDGFDELVGGRRYRSRRM